MTSSVRSVPSWRRDIVVTIDPAGIARVTLDRPARRTHTGMACEVLADPAEYACGNTVVVVDRGWILG